MKKTNFIIAGAPKCGTTALHTYLEQHSQISVLPKEIHFFGIDLSYCNSRMTSAEYQKQVNLCQKPIIGEVAVWYLASANAAEEIYAYNNDCKIIVLLRNPVELMYSLYSQMRYTGNEPIADFLSAVKLNNQRLSGKNLPTNHLCPTIGLCYLHVVKFYEQIKRYQKIFDEKQLLILTFENFSNNPAKVYLQILEFIGAETNQIPDFKKINSNKATKNEKLRDFTLHPPEKIKHVVKSLIPSKKIREKLKTKIWEVNTEHVSRESLSKETIQELSQFVANDMEKLKTLIDIDLKG